MNTAKEKNLKTGMLDCQLAHQKDGFTHWACCLDKHIYMLCILQEIQVRSQLLIES